MTYKLDSNIPTKSSKENLHRHQNFNISTHNDSDASLEKQYYQMMIAQNHFKPRRSQGVINTNSRETFAYQTKDSRLPVTLES